MTIPLNRHSGWPGVNIYWWYEGGILLEFSYGENMVKNTMGNGGPVGDPHTERIAFWLKPFVYQDFTPPVKRENGRITQSNPMFNPEYVGFT